MDTGADFSVLPYRNYCTKSESRTPDTYLHLTAANGSSISTYGTKLLSVNLGLRRNFKFPFILATVDRPIIGADFLAEFGLLVDLRKKRLIDSFTGLSVNAMTANVGTSSPRNFSIDNDSHLLSMASRFFN